MASRPAASPSIRAVADRDEEFPDFTKFFIETPPDGGDTLTVYALLDGPSVTGAYKFLMTRGKAVVMDIEHTLHLRKDVERLGIAPLTTMFWFSETVKETAIDWRPEVHDSDGLSLWTGGGERLWRALNNPERTTASAFSDQSPKATAPCSGTASSITTSTAFITTAGRASGSSRWETGARAPYS